MSIKFPKFPILVREEIIKNLNYAAIFNMSLCSIKTANTIKLVNFNKPKILRCILGENDCAISIENNDFSKERMGVICRGETNYKTPIEVKFGNVKQAFEFHLLTPPYFQMHYDYNGNKAVENSMVQHLHKLFRQTLAIQLIINDNENFENIPFLENVTEVLVNCTVTAQIMEYVNKFSDVHLLLLQEKLNVVPEVSECQNVYIGKADEFTRTILQNFSARTLYLREAVCNNEDILKFINAWKNNISYQNIVLVYIFSKTHFDRDALWSQIETTPWDETTRPRTYKYRCPSFHDGSAFEFNTEHYRDIRRVDGKLASLNIRSHILSFCVWDQFH